MGQPENAHPKKLPEAIVIRKYYRTVWVHFWAGFKKHWVANMLAVVGGIAGVVMLVVTNVNPASQTSARIISVAAWPLSLLLLFLIVHIVRAPWKLHNAVQDERASELLALEQERKDELKRLQDAQTETRHTIESDHHELITGMATAHTDTKVALANIRRDLEEKERLFALVQETLKARLADAEAKLGRPHVHLTFLHLDNWRDVPDDVPRPPELTELLAECVDRDAFEVFIGRTTIGEFYLQSRAPIPKISCGESVKIEYSLSYTNARGIESTSYKFRGNLEQLLRDTWHASNLIDGQFSYELTVPLVLSYKDRFGSKYTTPMELVYIPGVPEMPYVRMLDPSKPQVSAAIAKPVPQSPESTKHAD
jgi:hypothetical protein